MRVTVQALAECGRLAAAFDAVRANRGMPGADRVTVDEFAADAPVRIAALSQELEAGTYHCLPVLRVEVAEGDKTRPLAIPTVRDRVVHRALADLLQPAVEPILSDAAWAFRPGRGAEPAARHVAALMADGRPAALRGDVRRFFEHIDHDLMLATLGRVVPDARILGLVRDMMRAHVLDHMTLHESLEGVHQGSPLSPLLSNLYMASFDQAIIGAGYPLVRYCDDFVVPCASAGEAEKARSLCERRLAALALSLHPEKTRVVPPGDSFVFLGFLFKDGCIGPSVLAVEALRHRLWQVARAHGATEEAIERVRRGWAAYYGTVPEDLCGPAAELMVTLAASPVSTGVPAGTPGAGEVGVGDFDDGDLRRCLALFAGREDRFAEERIDERGHRGFFLVHRPMGAGDLRDHVEGRRTVAAYPLRSNGTVRFAVIDVDVRRERLKAEGADLAADVAVAHGYAVRLREAARAVGVEPLLEDSGGKGRHVWMLFEEAVPAADARALAARLLAAAGEVPEPLRCEVFPDRDRARRHRDGPPVKLPWGVHGRTGRRCLPLDPDTGEQVRDLRRTLACIRTYPRADLERLVGRRTAAGGEAEQPEPAEAESPGPATPIEARRTSPAAPWTPPEAPWTATEAGLFEGLTSSARILERCAVMRYLFRKARMTAYLTHAERLVVLYAFGNLGGEVDRTVHRFMELTFNYDRRVTQRWIDTRKENPISCVRVREQFPEVTARLPCDCRLNPPPGGYPSPVLHAASSVLPRASLFPEAAAVAARRAAGGGPGAAADRREAERLLARIAELRRQQRGVEAALKEALARLDACVDRAGGGHVELSTGTLVRAPGGAGAGAAAGPTFRIEV